jgi:hypothetical protein
MLDLPSAFAADVGHNVEYKIRDLGTRSVTLFPTQAQVKREIKDVPLKVSRAYMLNTCLSTYTMLARHQRNIHCWSEPYH